MTFSSPIAHLAGRVRQRRRDAIQVTASFCEPCSQVCTAATRREALLDRYHQAVHRAGLFHS